MQNIEAIYTSTNYQNKYGNPPWGVHKFNHEGRQITVIGNLHTDTITTGLALLLSGEWENSKYGRQFAITRYFVPQPSSAAGLIKYLQQAPGIGIETAKKLYELFGDKCLDVVISEPEKAAAAIKWITADQMAVASQVLSASRDKARYIVPLIGLLDGIAFPRNLPDQILERKWPDPAGQIQRNPFCLAKFPRIGFALCDQLRSRLKLPTDMPERQYAAVNHVFSEYSDLTWLPKSRLLNAVTELLGVQSNTAAERLNDMVRRGDLEYREGYLSLRYAAEQERAIAELLMEMSGGQAKWPDISGEISKHQQEQVDRAFGNGRVAFLMGSAGSGKSYVASRIIRAFDGVVAACAPTGKAAQRLGEVLQEAGVPVQPKTIHSLFKARPSEDGWVWGETFCDADLLVCDESSMLDNFLALHILRSMGPDTHLLLIGDPHQLPPVSRGSLLRDWQAWCDSSQMNSYGLLTEIHRNSDEIVNVCSNVRQGKFPELYRTGTPGDPPTPNLQYVPATKDSQIRGSIAKFVRRLKDGEVKLGGVPINPLTDFQVLTSINENSPISRKDLNRFLQLELNHDAEGSHAIFKTNDKIIVTKNGKAAEMQSGQEVYIANGDIGVVTHSGRESVVVKLAGVSEREVVIKCGSGWGDLDLAFAITTHKSQGSQWPAVFVCLGSDYRASMVNSRQLLYTALSRAQEMCILCGSQESIRHCLAKDSLNQRKSFFSNWCVLRKNGHGSQEDSSAA